VLGGLGLLFSFGYGLAYSECEECGEDIDEEDGVVVEGFTHPVLGDDLGKDGACGAGE
jgi:hypothetical protein